MADTKISQLPVATTVNESDNFVVSRGGSNVRIPVSTLFKNIPTFIGNTQTIEQITTSGQIDVSKYISEIVTTNVLITLTLPAGISGQEKIIIFRNKGTANVVITPNNGIGFTTISLTETGHSVTLKYINNAWVIMSQYGITLEQIPQQFIPKEITTTTYTVLDSDNSLIFTQSNVVVTLPNAVTNSGREIYIRNRNSEGDFGANQEVSITSSHNNILNLDSINVNNVILRASIGRFVHLQSNGSYWVVISGN